MSEDLSQELRAFEGSEALANGDFSVCIRGADRIEAQAARIAELEAALRFYADPSKYTDIHGDDVQVPDFYSETDFGETARVALEGKKER